MSSNAQSYVAAWPQYLASEPWALQSVVDGLSQSQYWSAADLAQGQEAQLRLLSKWAARRVPYYKESRRMAKSLAELKQPSSSFWDAWRNIPVLTKPALRAQGPRMNASEVPFSHKPLGKTFTSGSTGIAVEVGTTVLTRLMWAALTLREHMWHRLDFTKRFGAMRYLRPADRDPRGTLDTNWGPPVSQLYRSGPRSYIHIAYPVEALADWLLRFNPHYLLTYPTVAAALLDVLGDSGRPPSLEEVRLISEPVPPDLETRLRKAWGVRVSEIYSANEMGNVAFRCREHGSLHVQAENVLVEILSDAGTPCKPGETGRVVITPLHNLATPLIRYDLGDYATVGEPCDCGRSSQVLRQVLGRVRNMVRTPDGQRFWPGALGKFRSMQSVRQAQYVQSALDTIQLRLVLNRPLTEDEERRIAELVRSALQYPFRVEIAPVSSIERGPTGKFEEFLSLLPSG
jgi:phenylacetate-CoA ligase